MKNCLIIIDVQNDFMPGGALEVAEGDKVVPLINELSSRFDKVVATQDWHFPGHTSFASTHGKSPFDVITVNGAEQVLWPDHCIPGTSGAEFHKDLDLRSVDLILRSGTHPDIDSYSMFFENDRKTETGLRYYLDGLKIREVYLCGLATDYCVYCSARDAEKMGFHATVILDACRGVDVPAGNVGRAIAYMKQKGIRVINHDGL